MATLAELGFKVDTSGLTNATGNLNKLSVAASNAETKANDSSAALGQFGRKAGQAGMQVQQLVGQIQGNQNVFLAVSAQATDLGYVLGYPLLGAVVGITAAFSGPLFSALVGTSEGIEDLKADLDALTDNFDTAADGSYRLSEELARLAMISEETARLKVAIETESARENIENLRAAMMDVFSDSTGDTFLTALDKLDGITRLDKIVSGLVENLKITTEEAKELQAAFAGATTNQDAESYGNLAGVLEKLTKTYGRSNGAVKSFSSEMAQFIETGVVAADNYKKLTAAGTDWEALLKKSGPSEKDHVAAIEKINAALKEELATTGATTAEVLRYRLEKEGATEKEIEAAIAIQTSIDARKKQIDVDKEAIKYTEALAVAYGNQGVTAKATALKNIEALEQSQRTREQVLSDGLAREKAIIASGLAEDVIGVDQANAMKLASDKNYTDQKRQLDEQMITSQLAVYSNNISALSGFTQSMNNALAAYGAESSNIGQKMLLASKVLMVAQAVMAAEMSAVMTRAAYAGAAAFAGPAAPAVIAAGEAMAQLNRGLGYASAALIAATQFAPATARELGGQVQAGQTVMVGERGPELITMGSMGGQVTSNKNLQQQSSPTIVLQVSTGVTSTVRAEMASMMPFITKSLMTAMRAR